MAIPVRAFDVIIVGAGPAGLSVGSELSKDFKVLVIDTKKEIQQTTKSWLSPAFVMDKAPDIRQFMDPGVKRFLTQTVDPNGGSPIIGKWDAKLQGGYYFAREHDLLAYWGEQIEKNGSTIMLETSYFDHEVMKKGGGRVEVVTSRGRLGARLLVDASGQHSMIRNKYELYRPPMYWWSVYGGLAKHPNGFTGDMRVGDYLLWGTFHDTNPDADVSLQHGHPVFEYELMEDNKSFPMVLFLRRTKVPEAVMEQQFQHILRHEKATADFRDVEIEEPKWGWYPSGGMPRHLAEDRVVFIGSAGRWDTPCGWGATFIFGHYKEYAANLKRALTKDALHRRGLADLMMMNVHGGAEMLLDKVVMHFFANAPAHLINKFITFFDENNRDGVPFIYCEKLLTLSITPKELVYVLPRVLMHFSVLELVHIFPKEAIPGLLIDVAELGLTVVEETLREILNLPTTVRSPAKFDSM